jgi:DNA-binding Xre family transcriptional regulator
MKTALRKTTNSRARRRARCHEPKHKQEKVATLVPTPTLPDLYAFEEVQSPEPLIALDARQLPSIEPEPVVLPHEDDLRAGLPNRSTWQRIRDARGDWTFRLGMRWTIPSKWPGLPWIPQVRREASYEPLPELPVPVVDVEKLGRIVHVGLARATRELREERYLDASQLAEDAGIPLWQLTAIEEARLSPIPFAVFSALASALDMKLSELLRRMEEAGKEAAQ